MADCARAALLPCPLSEANLEQRWSEDIVQPNDPRGRALLAGAGWTLAVVGAAGAFKSGMPEPIYLWSVGVVAAGWAGALLYALWRVRREIPAADASHTRALVDGLAGTLGLEIGRAHGELLRADDLLEHAIEQLVSAFRGMSDQAAERRCERAYAAAGGTAAGRRPRPADAPAGVDHLDAAVTALQFRDVLGQKLGHVRRQLEALQRVLGAIREAVDAPAQQGAVAADEGTPERLAMRIRDLLLGLEREGAVSPVQQRFMGAGEVELF